MPYIIAIRRPGDDVYYGPDRTFVRFIDGAQRYDKVPWDVDVLLAEGLDADVLWVSA